MFDYKIIIVIGFFLFLGWIYFIFQKTILSEKQKKDGIAHFIIVIKNQEWAVEGIMRNMSVLRKRLRGNMNITVVDADSQDKTGEILEKLKRAKEGEFSVVRINKEKTDN